MSTTVYDYVIIGAGAAGLHLALAMWDESWFADKKILILDRDKKISNDKTWCFWEKGEGKWDSIIEHSWNAGKFITNKHLIDLDLHPYRYKMLHALNFYDQAQNKINQKKNFQWITEEVQQVEIGEKIIIKTSGNTYFAKQVFDSRIDPSFYKSKDHYIRLLQHFKGWFLKTEDAVFDPNSFIMMDYRIKLKDSTSFMYILPTAKDEAVIEFTFFSPNLVDDEVYDEYLNKYVREVLNLDTFSVEKIEQGIIPMSNYPFHNANQKGILKIGTAGSWVKPSSGYSFKKAEKSARTIIQNIMAGSHVDKGLYQKKYNIYDTLFLDVLNEHNELGEALFTTMYQKNAIQDVFSFLDEETSIAQDIAIMASFKWKPFFKAIQNQYFKKKAHRP